MRRRFYLFLLVLGISIVIMPWVAGVYFKHHYLQVIDLVNQDGRIKIDLLSYEKGWLHSHAKARITFIKSAITNLPQVNLTAPVTIIIEEKISHGPILYDHIQKNLVFGYANIQSTILPNEKNLPAYAEVETAKGIIEIQTLVKLHGRWVGDIHIPAINVALPIGKIHMLGLDCDFKMTVRDNYIKHLVIEMKTGTISINVGVKNPLFTQMVIQPLKYDTDSLKDKNGLWSGNITLFTPGVSITTNQGKNITTDNIVINNKFGIIGSTFYATNLAINISNLITGNPVLPSLPALHVYLSADNFSANGIYNYLTFIKQQTPEALQKLDFKMIEKLIFNTITNTSILKADVSADTLLGGFTLKSNTSLQPHSAVPNTMTEAIDNSITTATVTASTGLTTKIIEVVNAGFATEGNVASGSTIINDNLFHAQLVQLLKQNKISVTVALRIAQLEERQLPVETFAAKLKDFQLPSDVMNNLVNIYRDSLRASANNVGSAENKAATQQILDDLEQLGGLKRDNDNNYNTTITFSNGALKLNGWVVN